MPINVNLANYAINSDGSYDFRYPAGDKPAGGALDVPTNISAVANGSSIDITWTDAANTTSTFIFSGTTSGSLTYHGFADVGTEAYTITGLANDTYYVALMSHNSSADTYSALSAEETVVINVSAGGGFNGTTVTFNGSGYGTGNTAFTWSDNTDQDNTATLYRENGGAFHNSFAFDNTVQIGNRTGSLKSTNKCQIKPNNNATTPAIYVTWWQRFSTALNDGSTFDLVARPFETQSNKFVRIWNGDDTNTDTWISWTNRHLTYPDTPSSQNVGTDYENILPTANQFNRFEILVEGTNITTKVNGVVENQVTDFVKQDAGSDFYTQLFGYDMNYTDHILQNFDVHLAEMYRLPSQARIEVSDSATWNNGEITRYIQNCTTWTDSQIRFELFRGDFAQGTTLYAYAVQANGTVVSLGEIVESISINAPSGVAENNTLTINAGSLDFGTKTTAKPFLYADFESGVQPDATLGQATSWAETNNTAVSNTHTIGASTQSLRWDAGAGSTISIRAPSTDFDDLYVFRRFRDEFDIAADQGGSGFNLKRFRLWRQLGGDVNNNNNMYFAYQGSEGLSSGRIFNEYTNAEGARYSTSIPQEQGVWQTQEYIYSTSQVDVQDGRFDVYEDGAIFRSNEQYRNRTTTAPNKYRQIVFDQISNGTASGPLYMYTDQVYIDTTYQRVMIAREPTWSTATKKQVLIPTAWTSSQIDVVIKLGEFSASEDLYLYVIDSNDNVINENGALI